VSGNTAAFRASGGVANRIYTSDGGPTSRHIGFGDAAPTGTFSTLSDPAFAGSTLAFLGEFGASGVGSAGIFTQSLAGVRTTVAKTGDPAPGGFGTFGNRFAGRFDGVTPPDTDGERVVFGAGAPSPAFTTFGVFTGSVSGGDLDLVARTGDPAPVGTFSGFSGFSISGSEVGFVGLYNGVDSGVFTRSGAGPLVVRAKTGDPAPVGTFRFFGPISVGGDGTAVFGAAYTGDQTGLFFSDGVTPTPTPILLEGDALFGSTVVQASALANSYDVSNGKTVAFSYQLADGRIGVALATLPEPGCGGVLALLGAALLSRGRVAKCRSRVDSVAVEAIMSPALVGKLLPDEPAGCRGA
jgi:hypothetical protein